jgi:hypothetical protein
MKERIEQQLSVLIGLSLLRAGRAADLAWFEFGRPQKKIMRDGSAKELGEFALHVQCSWRIRSAHEIVVASQDLYYPPGDSSEIPDGFDWDVPNGNRRDQRMSSWIQQHASNPLTVTAIRADQVGSVELSFADDYVLDVFPDDSLSDTHSERWRFFRLYKDTKHFVVTGSGIQE